MHKLNQHRQYLLTALELAKEQRGFCAPNPSVGAVIVSDQGVIVSSGSHAGVGFSHAEVIAINKFIKSNHSVSLLNTATLYVTLEPCCHFGRTPPCTDAIISAGISKVVYSYRDPNPLVSGEGASILQGAGISCEYIPLPEIDSFYQSYYYWHQTNRPFVTAKIAMTLNGKVAGISGSSIKITGSDIDYYTHCQRKACDAILSTSKTIISDDPQLNVRLEKVISKPLYLLDTNINLPLDAKIFSTAKSITIFHGEDVNTHKLIQLSQAGVRCLQICQDQKGLILDQVLDIIGRDGVQDLWVETGRVCFTALSRHKLLQRALIYISPHTLLNGVSLFDDNDFFDFSNQQVRWEQVGKDVLLEINFSY